MSDRLISLGVTLLGVCFCLWLIASFVAALVEFGLMVVLLTPVLLGALLLIVGVIIGVCKDTR